jgi:hypothetical protein
MEAKNKGENGGEKWRRKLKAKMEVRYGGRAAPMHDLWVKIGRLARWLETFVKPYLARLRLPVIDSRGQRPMKFFPLSTTNFSCVEGRPMIHTFGGDARLQLQYSL